MVNAKRILVVEDEKHISDVVEYVLLENAFEVVVAADGNTGLERFREEHPDLVLLDLKLPGIPGLDLFRKMRRLRPDAPIIMLTSYDEEIDRVLGLELGADDYVTKPFSTRELVARIRNVLRRTACAAPAETVEASVLKYGPLSLDSESFCATYAGKSVPLTRTEFRFLEILLRRPTKVFTREELIEHIYEGCHAVADRSIDAYVKRLRRKLTADNDRLSPIETVHSVGYKLNRRIGEIS
jgi:DNA-binding response OmpR family regulator